ncbi:MAG: hypothetical protein ACI91G_001294 [Gammaproteobacteria bacterium]|jgi:hypothetical protein
MLSGGIKFDHQSTFVVPRYILPELADHCAFKRIK